MKSMKKRTLKSLMLVMTSKEKIRRMNCTKGIVLEAQEINLKKKRREWKREKTILCDLMRETDI